MKADAYLMCKEKISLSGPGISSGSGEGHVPVPVDIGRVKLRFNDNNPSTPSDKLCGILNRFLESHKSMSLKFRFKHYRREPSTPKLHVMVCNFGEDLRDLLTVLGSGLRFKLELTGAMTSIPSPGENVETIASSEMGLKFGKDTDGTPMYYFEDYLECPKCWLDVFGIPRVKYFAQMSLKICGDLVMETRLDDWRKFFANLCTLQSNSEKDQVLFIARRILEDGVQPDVVILVDKGTLSLACHKDMLSVHSDVLTDMAFETNVETAASGEAKIEMLDMSSEAGLALQRFLYDCDLEGVDDFGTAMELLDCADKYSVGTLEEAVMGLLMLPGDQWLDVMGNAMNLFFFTKKTGKYPELERKALEKMKRNRTTLLGSSDYKQLCMKDPLAFMQLCNALIMLN